MWDRIRKDPKMNLSYTLGHVSWPFWTELVALSSVYCIACCTAIVWRHVYLCPRIGSFSRARTKSDLFFHPWHPLWGGKKWDRTVTIHWMDGTTHWPHMLEEQLNRHTGTQGNSMSFWYPASCLTRVIYLFTYPANIYNSPTKCWTMGCVPWGM
jgi:hypothetical protein